MKGLFLLFLVFVSLGLSASRGTKVAKAYNYTLVLVTYADPPGSIFERTQALLNTSALSVGNFDRVISWNLEKLVDSAYWEYFSSVSMERPEFIEHPCMLWLWKPWIIREALQGLEDGDFVLYADSSKYHPEKGFSHSVIPLANFIAEHETVTKGVMLGMRMNYPAQHAISRHERAEYSPPFSVFRQYDFCSYLHRMGLCDGARSDPPTRRLEEGPAAACCSNMHDAWMFQTSFSLWQRTPLSLRLLDDVLSWPEIFLSQLADQISFTVWGAVHGLGGFYLPHRSDWGGWDDLKDINRLLASLSPSDAAAGDAKAAADLVLSDALTPLGETAPSGAPTWCPAEIQGPSGVSSLDHAGGRLRHQDSIADQVDRGWGDPADPAEGAADAAAAAAEEEEELAGPWIGFLDRLDGTAVYPYRFEVRGQWVLRPSAAPDQRLFVSLSLDGVAQLQVVGWV